MRRMLFAIHDANCTIVAKAFDLLEAMDAEDGQGAQGAAASSLWGNSIVERLGRSGIFGVIRIRIERAASLVLEVR